MNLQSCRVLRINYSSIAFVRKMTTYRTGVTVLNKSYNACVKKMDLRTELGILSLIIIEQAITTNDRIIAIGQKIRVGFSVPLYIHSCI